MKKQILKTITIFGLIFSSNLLAITPPTPEEYKEIADSFKLIDTSKKELSKTYMINMEIVKGKLEKQDDGLEQSVQHIILLGKNNLGEPGGGLLISKYDQKLLAVACIAPDKKMILTSIVRTSFDNKKQKKRLVEYSGLIAEIDKNTCCGNYALEGRGGLFEGEVSSFDTSIPTYNPKEFYPYYNEQRILNRLYETNTCDKELTEKANIEVLVGDKWIPQEQSWNIKKEELNLNEVLKNLKEKKETNLSIENLNVILKNEELNQKTVQKYNDIAYYLQQKNANNEAIFLLEKIIEKFPNRTVAYLNLADAYDGINDKEKAKENYEKYINLMKQDNKEVKIPKRVLEFK